MNTKINEFSIRVATVNGTGSASANELFIKSIFRMGIPITGKNIFPSNIQGLPTWYDIRISAKGYNARTAHIDVLVGMNIQTYKEDIQTVAPGGYFIFDSTWPLPKEILRSDINYIGLPLAEICAEKFGGSRLLVLMKNITYVGALVELLGVDLDLVEGQLREKFAKKPKLIDSNMDAIRVGIDSVRKVTDVAKFPLKVQRMDQNKNNIMIDGNTAAGLGAVYAGATVAGWYPITPSTTVMDSFAKFCGKLRRDSETGERNHIIIQAEDELAAIGMVIGANWNGARSFTATSGPGISLMNEFLSYAYFTEIPTVLVDVQRTGPSTGMPTRTQQSDLMICAYAGHGDTKHIVLIPKNPTECFDMMTQAFDLADRFQTPVFLLTDLDIGMNDWNTPRLEWDDQRQPDKGKVLSAADLEKVEKFYRYMDVDGDGVCARTLPGTHPTKGAYFTRGSGHNKFGAYTEKSDEYQEVMERLVRKMETAKTYVPKPEIIQNGGAKTALVSMGSCHSAVLEAIDILAAEGVKFDYMRIKAFPFSKEVETFMEKYDRIIVVEQNRDGQLRMLLNNETNVPKEKLRSCLYYAGMPITAVDVIKGIKTHL